ncbi:extensin precursor [Iris pallida]|uniref:Extensin n=1 Tax=Iris pallida TaxID=29817 RepID=A0AAX6E199_IRIPA|nr:extensin precursor [Iris pallida]
MCIVSVSSPFSIHYPLFLHIQIWTPCLTTLDTNPYRVGYSQQRRNPIPASSALTPSTPITYRTVPNTTDSKSCRHHLLTSSDRPLSRPGRTQPPPPAGHNQLLSPSLAPWPTPPPLPSPSAKTTPVTNCHQRRHQPHPYGHHRPKPVNPLTLVATHARPGPPHNIATATIYNPNHHQHQKRRKIPT